MPVMANNTVTWLTIHNNYICLCIKYLLFPENKRNALYQDLLFIIFQEIKRRHEIKR